MFGQWKQKVGLEILERREKEVGKTRRWRRERKMEKRRWKKDGAEPPGLEEPQVARNLIAGE